MNVPSFLSPFLDGDSPKRLFQGLVVGAIGTMIIGFNWGGWHRGATVDQMVATASQTTLVKALAPICADKFLQAAQTDNTLKVSLDETKSWDRDNYLQKTGWATFPGGSDPDIKVAAACAEMLKVSLELK
ncbi:MAG: hypothetical protein OEU36_00385 [Gammaproteobacteria bacterium]|nr:hypothetical protein [Gammaproteobacteria bacterium]